MGDEAAISLSSAANGTLPSSSHFDEEAPCHLPPNSEDHEDRLIDHHRPLVRLNDDPETSEELPASRPRTNASDYSVNPRSPRASFDKGKVLDSVISRTSKDGNYLQNGGTSTLTISSNLPPRSLNGSLTSVDDDKVVVEDNEDIIKESPTLAQKEFSPEASSELDGLAPEVARVDDEGGSGSSHGSEPEPGASLEPMDRTLSLTLPLVTPGDSVSDDEGSETQSTAPIIPEESADDSDELGSQEYPAEWYTEQKHVFIFSEAGKPIYSRYGKEENIVGLFGVMQALLSCVQDNQDDLQCIRTSDRLFVFRCHPPLIMVAVSHLKESEEQLSRQLKYLHNQAVFFLTQSHMARLFKNRHNYDLRRQLTGLPKFFNRIIQFSEEEHSFLLESIRCLPMPQSLRSEITSILLTNRCPELVFAIVIYERQIITVVRPKQYVISPQDLHLLMNYVQTGSMRGHGEKWAPCCLPDFNNGGYLYIHDSYISDTMNVSLVLITNEREQHITMIECKQSIVEQMLSMKTLDKLEAVIANPFVCSDTKIPQPP